MKRHALFVGVNNYSDKDIHPLHFAVEDATDLAGFFKHCAKFNRAEVLTDPRNCDAVLERVHDMLSGLGPGDEFLFFFAGHGVTTHDGHRLVCSSDRLSAVKHAWAGLPLERLKLETAGSFNRLFLLDACRSDVLATNRGASCAMKTGTRDLIMAGASSADEKDGVLTILCSCDDNECAGESAELRHGLFSKAMLEILDEEHRDGRIVLVDDDFVYRRLKERMRLLAQESGMDFSQKPQKRGPAILLLDGIASTVENVDAAGRLEEQRRVAAIRAKEELLANEEKRIREERARQEALLVEKQKQIERERKLEEARLAAERERIALERREQATLRTNYPNVVTTDTRKDEPAAQGYETTGKKRVVHDYYRRRKMRERIQLTVASLVVFVAVFILGVMIYKLVG